MVVQVWECQCSVLMGITLLCAYGYHLIWVYQFSFRNQEAKTFTFCERERMGKGHGKLRSSTSSADWPRAQGLQDQLHR